MRLFHQVFANARALFRGGRVDADLADEMRFHVEREMEANVARGMSPDAARRAARLTFGSVDAAREQSRDERPGAGAREFIRDVRYGTRLFRKSPSFGVAAVAIVALGIGSATAIFSVVHGVLLRPLPYHEPDRLVSIWLLRGEDRARVYPSAADAMDLRQLPGVFEDVAFLENSNLNLTGDGEPRRLQGADVSVNLFSVLGVSAALGRTFAPDEDREGRQRVVLLSDALWRGRFGADRGVLGQQIQINGAPHTVVGVMPPDFRYPSGTHEAWVPLVVAAAELTRQETDNYRVVARLASTTSIEQARRAASALDARVLASQGSSAVAGMAVDSMHDDVVRGVRPALTLLLGAVACLVLIACANLANLFGARATARTNEFAVRLALGASRRRLIAQAVAEAVPVLALGGVVGILIARWALRALIGAAPAGLPRIENVSLSAPVLAFSVALLALTGVAASLVPAFRVGRSDFTTITKDGGRSSTAGRRRATGRRIGVAAQIAFALPLLVGAAVLLRSALSLTQVDLGFRAERVATFAYEVSRTKHPSDQDVANYYGRLVEAVRAVPGVADAGITNRIPLAGGQTNLVGFERAGGLVDTVDIDTRTVSPSYFSTLGIALKSGRTFADQDADGAPAVVIVDDRVAEQLWPGESAIGRRVLGPTGEWATVVGVVGHVRTASVEIDPRPQVYWSFRQWTQNRGVLAVRSEIEPAALYSQVVNAIRSVDRDQAVFDVRTMPEIIDQSLAQRRLTTALIAGFGGVALLLAAVGIYGVVAYGVTQRMREFGIRVALGATNRQVTRLVVWQGASMAIAGSIVGLVLAIAAAGVMRNLVYGVTPRDVTSIVGATTVLMLVALLASYIPARRAAGVDPALPLRAE